MRGKFGRDSHMGLIEKIQQKSEGQRRALMFFSMVILSFLVLVIAWKSFERNLGTRLGNTPEENGEATPGPLQSLIEDAKRIAGGEEPLTQELGIRNNESRGMIERILSFARETRRVVKYNVGEIVRWVLEIAKK